MFRIKVDYKVSEYRNILMEFIPIMSSKRKTGDWPKHKVKATFWMKILIFSAGTIVFFYKLSKVGSCLFEFSDSGIVRNSKLGKKNAFWDEVLNIHVLDSGYLLELNDGAMPLPYRCFERSQKKEFEKLSSIKLHTYKDEET